MRILGIILILAFAALNSVAISSNDFVATVRQLPIGNNLPSKKVERIYHDNKGFVWIGTDDGLSRYDGHRIKTWRSDIKNPSLFSNNSITAITETNEGDLLVGTERGLNIIDVKTGKTRQFEDSELRDHAIREIVTDKDGTIWVGTYIRLCRLDKDLDKVSTYDTSLPVTSVNTIYRDKDDNLWVAFWDKGLFRYNRTSDRFEKMPPFGLRDNPMRVLQTNDGYLVSTWGDGLFRLKFINNEPVVTPVEVTSVNKSDFDIIFELKEDRNGNIWMIGLKRVYAGVLSGNTFSCYQADWLNNPIFSTPDHLVMDKGNMLWLSSGLNGISILDTREPLIRWFPLPPFDKKDGNINPIMKAIHPNGRYIWFNQPRVGLVRYDKDSERYATYMDIPQLNKLQGLRDIIDIVSLGQYSSDFYLMPEFNTFVYHVRTDSEGNIIDVSAIILGEDGGAPRLLAKDNSGRMWIATDRWLILRTENGQLLRMMDQPVDFTSMVVDNRNNLFIASESKGIIRVELKQSNNGDYYISQSAIPETSGMIVKSLAYDPSTDIIWAVGQLGDIKTISCKTFDINDITQSINLNLSENLYDVIIDGNGQIWLTTSKNIYHFSPDGKSLVHIPVPQSDRMISLSNNSFYYDKKNKLIYFGCNDGYMTLDIANTDSLNKRSIKTPVLSDVKIAGTSIYGSDKPYSKLEDGVIVLPSDAHNIQFEFSALDYSGDYSVKYSYRLSGVDKDWVSLNDGEPMAFFNELPSGKNTLEIRATYGSGEWSPIATYTIKRLPAWWETWWAYLIYVCVAAAIIYTLYWYVHHRMELKNQITKAQFDKKNVEELTELKLKYFANISHDFLTPITIISCLIDDLEMTYGKIGPQLDKVRFNLSKVKRLIQQILDFRKCETGNMHLHVSENELCEFIDNICRNHFLPLMEKKHINFNYDKDCERLDGYFDTDKVEKVLFNLISNAYKYTPEGGTIDVSLQNRVIDGHTYAVIKVSDTGTGISEKNLKNIFNRFYTVDEKKSESNGIGLALVKDLLTLHHGEISVESKPGKGTVFTVTMPVSKDCFSTDEIVRPVVGVDEITTNMPHDLEAIDTEGKEVNSDVTLLLVEDNEELLTIMRRMFSQKYNVLTAKNGVEALDVIDKNDIDIIISDVMMPEMDGLTMCGKIKSDIKTSHIPLILLTAKSRTEDRVECYKAGADGYIAKPFELKVLEARIENFLSNKESRQKRFQNEPESTVTELEMSPLDKSFLDKIVSVIEQNLTDSGFDIDRLAESANMSRSAFYRKIKVITGMSPVEFLRSTKLKKAYELLKQGELNISQVAYASGFSNPKYFSTCFKEQFGISPSEVNRG